jgi:hypothetical protein
MERVSSLLQLDRKPDTFASAVGMGDSLALSGAVQSSRERSSCSDCNLQSGLFAAQFDVPGKEGSRSSNPDVVLAAALLQLSGVGLSTAVV